MKIAITSITINSNLSLFYGDINAFL